MMMIMIMIMIIIIIIIIIIKLDLVHGVNYLVSSSIYVGFVVDKAVLGQLYLRILQFPLSVKFHQRSTLAFIYTLLLPERQNRALRTLQELIAILKVRKIV
jgi:hypothetical protein